MIKVTYLSTDNTESTKEYPTATRYELENGVFHLFSGSRAIQVAAFPSGRVISLEVVNQPVQINTLYNTQQCESGKTGCGRAIQ